MSGFGAAIAVAAGCGLVASPLLIRWVGHTVGAAPNEASARSRTYRTVVVGLALGSLAGLAGGWQAELLALVALALVATPLVIIDIEVHRLPNRLVCAAALAGAVLLAVAAALRSDWPAYLRSIESAAAVFALLFVLVLIAPSGFGFGDVKLAAVLGGYLGWAGWLVVFYGIFAGFVLGTLIAFGLMATGRATRKTAIAFGPMLIFGAFAVLALDQTTGVVR